MRDLPENELLSAYLDGELTADQQAEVEELLSRSPAARQLLDELRTLSSTLQTLPRYKLQEDLSQQVLRIAERRILTEPSQPGDLPKPAPRPGRAILRRVFNSRALVWSSLAVAVAVMLTVINRNPQDEIALAPSGVEKRGAGTAEIGPAPGAEQGRDKSASQAAPAQNRPGGASKGATEPRHGHYGQAQADNGDANNVDGNNVTAREVADESRTPRKGKGGAGGYGINGLAGGGAVLGLDADDLAQVVDGARAKSAGDLVQPDGPYAVVYCDISPKALQEQAFDQVLAANDIALEGAWATGGVVEMDLSNDARAGFNLQRARQQGGEPREEQKKVVAGTTLAHLAQAGELDLVCVQATPAQIKGTLDALKVRTAEFLSVSVMPAPGVVDQKDWPRQYGRSLSQKARQSGNVQADRREAPKEAPEDAAAAHVSKLETEALQELHQGVQVEKSLSLGRAWRLQLPRSAARGRVNLRAGDAAEQPRPEAARGSARQAPPAPPDRPPVPSMAQYSAEVAAEARQPVSSPIPHESPSRPPAGPSPQRPPETRRDIAEKSADAGRRERLDETSRGVSGRAIMPPADAPQRTSQAERGAQPGSSGRPGLKRPRVQPAPAGSQQDVQPRTSAGRRSTIEHRAKAGSQPEQGQELHRQKQGPERPRRPAVTYRVFFVLRMIGPEVGGPPSSAASLMEQAEPPAATKR